MTQGFKQFAVSVAINFIIASAVFIFFGIFRRSRFVSRYYAPRRYIRNGRKRPARLPYSFYKWIPIVYRYTEQEVIDLAGMDAAMYLRVLMFGAELFFFLTLWCIIVVLPTNLSGHEVNALMSSNNQAGYSNFTYWVPAPPPPPPGQASDSILDSSDSDQPLPIGTPKFYADTPPAPAGLTWWHYRSGVPPLPQPATYFGMSNWSDWGWQYDSDYTVPFYQFSNLDQAAMTNLHSADHRLWVHLLSVYVISWFIYKLLWRFNKEAVALRIQYLMNTKEGAESHTVLVTDIPVLEYGTIPHRIETTVFRYLPQRVKESIKKVAKVGFGLAETGLSSTIGRANKVLLHGESISLPPGLAGLPKNISDLPANILSALPDIIARQRRGSKGPLSPRGSSADKEANLCTDSVINEGDCLIAAAGPGDSQTLQDSAPKPGLQPAAAAGSSANDVIISLDKTESTDKEKYYDAKSTTLPIFGRHSVDAEVITEPREAEPQEPEELEPGAGAGQQDVTELDAWLKCGALSALGMPVQEITESEFKELFPDQVVRVGMVHDTSHLDPLVKEYEQLKRKLEDLLDEYLGRQKHLLKIKRRKVKVVGPKYGLWGLRKYGTTLKNIDCLEFWPDRLRCLSDLIQQQQEAAKKLAVPAAFVTFKTRRSQVIASSSLLHHDQSAWTADAAPNSEELVWDNLGWRSWERKLRFAAVWGAFFALALFYIIPISAVQGLINVSRIQSTPGLRTLANLPVISGLLTSFLPSLILRIFLALLPNLLAFMNHLQGMTSLSQVDFGVMRKFFIFQVLTVFFGSFIAGSLLNQIQSIVHNPTSIVRTLGDAAPQVAVFFMTYLLLMGLSSKPVGFLRLLGLLFYNIKSQLASTQRARARLWQEQHMSFGSEVPDHTMAILLGLGFCVVAPLIAPIALLYFLVCTLIGKYQMVYVFTPSFQSGGRIWQQAFDQIIVAILIFQLLMIGLVGLKEAPIQAGLMAPLPFITLIYRFIAGAMFLRPQQILSLRGAADLDKREQDQGSAAAAEARDSMVESLSSYKAPALLVTPEELQSLLKEAKRVDCLISGKPVQPEDLEVGDALDDESMEDAEDDVEEFFPASSNALPIDDDSPTRRAVAEALAASFRTAPKSAPLPQSSDPQASQPPPVSQA